MSENFKMIAKTFYGFEEILSEELLKLGAQKIIKGNRNVSFYGDKGFMYKSNISLRTALKIIKPIKEFKFKDIDEYYKKIYEIKIKNPNLTNIQAFEIFIASDDYNEISSGNFHDKWFKELESNDYVDKSTKKKINQETIRLLQIQKDTMIKQLMKIPKLYYAKSHFPLELSQRAFDHLWRVCENYELWCLC